MNDLELEIDMISSKVLHRLEEVALCIRTEICNLEDMIRYINIRYSIYICSVFAN